MSVLGQWRTEPEVSNGPRMLAGQDAILAGAAAKAGSILRCDHRDVASFSDTRVFADAPPAGGSCK